MSKPTYDELLQALDNLIDQIVEDLPAEYRQPHMIEALTDARDLVGRAFA